MRTNEWFSINQKVEFGTSSDIDDGAFVCLVKKLKENLVAVIVSNKDKGKITPAVGDELYLFPEKDGAKLAMRGAVVQINSYPLIIIKFTEEPVMDDENSTVDLEMPLDDEKSTADLELPSDEDSSLAGDTVFAQDKIDAEDELHGEMELPDEDAHDVLVVPLEKDEDVVTAMPAEEMVDEDIPDVIGVEDDDIDDGVPTLSLDDDDDEDYGVPTLSLDDDDDEDYGVPTLSLDEDDDEDYGVPTLSLDEDEEDDDGVPTLSLDEDEEDEGEESSLDIYNEIDEDELEGDEAVMVGSGADVDEDAVFDETQEIDATELSGEREVAVDKSLEGISDNLNSEDDSKEDIEVPLGDMSEAQDQNDEALEGSYEADEPEPSLDTPPPDSSPGYQEEAPIVASASNAAVGSFPDFFPIAIYTIDNDKIKTLGPSIEAGSFDRDNEQSLSSVDLKAVDPDMRPVFIELFKKVDRIEKAVGGATLSGTPKNAICLSLASLRIEVILSKPLDIDQPVVVCAERFWSPPLSFIAAGTVTACKKETFHHRAVLSFTHLAPGAKENITDYLSSGAAFFDSLSDLKNS